MQPCLFLVFAAFIVLVYINIFVLVGKRASIKFNLRTLRTGILILLMMSALILVIDIWPLVIIIIQLCNYAMHLYGSYKEYGK